MKQADIKINVELDENNIPKHMEWEASENGNKKEACKAAMMCFWDAKIKNTARIDLWVKDMPLDEMKFFFYQSIMTMSETYMRATSDEKTAHLIRNLGDQIGSEITGKK